MTDKQQLAEACARHMFADDAASQAMGMRIESVSPGTATLVMTVREDMVNGHDICHGGKIFCLADSAFAFACNSENHAAVAGSCTIDFLRPAVKGDCLMARATVSYQGRRAGIYNVAVTNQRDELVALFKGNSVRLNRPVIAENEPEK